jgi:hypothetical protein
VHDRDPAPGSSAARPLSWQQAREAAWSADLAGPPTGLVVRAVVVTCVAFAVAGVLGGWLWAQLADPPAYEVLRAGAIMGEEQAGREFGVDVTYALIGLGLAIPLGLLAGWRWHRVGWPEVLAAAGGAGIAAVVAWQLGVWWGPDDPVGLLSAAQPGDLLSDQLDVHAKGLLLAWPVGALIGVIIAVLVFSRPSRPRPYGGNGSSGTW